MRTGLTELAGRIEGLAADQPGGQLDQKEFVNPTEYSTNDPVILEPSIVQYYRTVQ